MNTDRVKKLKRGDRVAYPADRGTPGGVGNFIEAGSTVYHTLRGTPFVWVTVQHIGRKAVWPSNRLG